VFSRPARLTFCGLLLLVCAACSETGAPIEPSGLPPMPPPASARYEVVFESTWHSTTHPTDFPASAHYSGLIGGTHNDAASFWREGTLASEGIRRMAERGAKSPLDQEVLQAIAAGAAEFVLSGGSPPTPGSVRLEFAVSQAFPLVTLVAMVAPSPDWFVGVSSVPLFDNGAWVAERRIDLFPYDAGTDSGVTYGAPDQETLPHQPIALLRGYPVAANGRVAPFGTFTFRRVQ
jgi:hypothetical protein